MSEPEAATNPTPDRTWSRKKKDQAPRGVRQLVDGTWGVRFSCAMRHLHKERVGKVKREAIAVYHERRARAMSEPGWCPRAERQQVREEAARQREATRLEGERAVSVRQYAERWLKVHVEPECRERTARQYRSVLEGHVYPAFGAVPIRDLRRRDLRAFIAEKQGAGLTRGTLKNIVVPLAAMLNAAVDDEHLAGNPAAGLWRQRRRARTEQEAKKATALSAEELARILRAADEHASEHSDFLHVLAWTGCRLSEACGLQWSDFDFAGAFLEVRRTAAYRAHRILITAPKSGKARRVDLPHALVDRLRRRLSIQEAESVVAGRELSPWVFPAPSDESKPVNGAFVRYKVWYPVLKAAESRAVRLHDLRHTYASLLLQAGEAPIYVKEQLGHSSIQVTVDLYGHIRPGQNRAAVDRLAAATTGDPAPATPAGEQAPSGGELSRN